MAWRIYKTDYSQKFTFPSAVRALGLGAITYRWRTLGTFVKCRVGISNLDGDASSKFFTMGAGPDSCNGLDKSRLAVVYMARSANIDGWLISIFFDIPIWKSLFPMQQLVS
jgi:hypothetical protein